MKNTFKKLSVFVLLIISVFALVGCNGFDSLFNTGPDPLLQDIETKEQALDFMINTAKSWNNLKAKVQLASIVTLPLEGHFDYTAQKAYIEKYETNEENEKEVSKYYYLEGNNIYTCTYQEDGTPVYTITNSLSELGFEFEVRLQDYLSMISEEKINSLDLSTVSFEKTENQIKLGFTFSNGSKSYDIDFSYKNKTIKCSIGNIGTILFTEDDPNYFENLNIDLSLFN